ncbi:MAG TPA: alpha/beta hydrolase [Candidatus Binatia bacterium]|nr:alpha/beta hydrolase [Candidatus Binatia bacterium]
MRKSHAPRMIAQHITIWWLGMFALSVSAQSEWTDKSPHKSGFVTVNGVRLHYLDWGGKGEAMLFLHGIGDTPHIYDVLAPKFTNQFRVLGLTRRGHGESKIPDDGYDTATRVEDIRQFLDALNIPRAILVGHSAAGGEVTMFAGKHPDRAIKIVYLDAVFDTDRRLELLRRMPAEMTPPEAAESLDSVRRWQKRMNNGWSEAWEATLRVHFSPDGNAFLNQERRSRALGMMLEPGAEAQQDFTKIKSRALNITVVGFPSNMVNYFKALPEPRRKSIDEFFSSVNRVKEKETERFRKELPGARVVAFTNADHHCFIDREDDVVREMRAFLGK